MGMKQLEDLHVSIIGAGIIGGAIAEALSTHCRVTATRRQVERLNGLGEKGITVTTDNIQAASQADIIILSVKPSQVVPVLREIAGVSTGKPVISFAAAISLEILHEAAPECRFVRAMTNIAAKVAKGYTLFAPDDSFQEEELALIEKILRIPGEIRRVEEQYLDVLTAMSGSGPAYIFTVVESMIYGALREGLPRKLALEAAAHTAIGAASLLLETGKHPSELKDLVLTPGGVTIDGIYELEESRIRTAFMKAISAASARARVLSEEAGKQARNDINRDKL
jgi:pyrroline-5-carboxylate reductase